MGKKIRIVLGNAKVQAELNETKTAEAIFETLPITAEANIWGEEIYFEIPVEPIDVPDREEVEVGDLGYWPPGKAFCIFFGKTPVSTSEKPRSASKVTVIGKVGDIDSLKKVKDGESVRLEKSS